MRSSINLAEKLALISEHWSPRVVAELNDYQFKVVKLQGEFVWHSHEAEDELFLVLKGRLRMQFRDRESTVEPGELIIVPHQTEHRPVADEEVHVLLLEPGSQHRLVSLETRGGHGGLRRLHRRRRACPPSDDQGGRGEGQRRGQAQADPRPDPHGPPPFPVPEGGAQPRLDGR